MKAIQLSSNGFTNISLCGYLRSIINMNGNVGVFNVRLF
jgi:hypothetical protein